MTYEQDADGKIVPSDVNPLVARARENRGLVERKTIHNYSSGHHPFEMAQISIGFSTVIRTFLRLSLGLGPWQVMTLFYFNPEHWERTYWKKIFPWGTEIFMQFGPVRIFAERKGHA